MSIYEPIRDAFREWNRLLIDKQQWDAEHELRRADLEIKNRLAESEMHDQMLRRSALEVQHRDMQRQLTPQPIRFNLMVGNDPDILGNPDLMNQAMALTGATERGVRYSKADGLLVDAEGTPIEMNLIDQEQLAIGVQGIISSYNLTPLKAQRRVEQIEQQLSDLPVSPHTQARRAGLQADLNQARSFFSPEGQITYFGQQRQQMEAATQWALQAGRRNLAEYFRGSAENFARGEREAMARVGAVEKAKGTWSVKQVYSVETGKPVGQVRYHSGRDVFRFRGEEMTELPAGLTLTKPTVPTEKWTDVYKAVSRRFGKEDALGNIIITPGLEAQHDVAQARKNELMAEGKLKPQEIVEQSVQFVKQNDRDFLSGLRTIIEDKELTDLQKAELIHEDMMAFQSAFNYLPEDIPAQVEKLLRTYGR